MEDLSRDFQAAYEDKFDVPPGTCTVQERISNICRYPDEMNGYGSNRPSPRNVSNVLFHQIEPIISSRKLSDMHAHFGQFLTHDIDFSSPLPRFEFESTLNSVWMPISVPKGDVHFDRRDTGKEYLSFVRSTFN
ncbi:peroxinectin A, partial [Exaiptasia diaphana]|uniref:Peroxidase n=1 Tax=Exaiptasia diaphana TaxID=2652724 RepID=A0A913YBY4_EXADI